MRKNRVIEQNRCYHLVSRLAHRAFFLDDEEKDRAVALMRRVEEFSGVVVLAYAFMSNHFHIFIYVPSAEEIGEGEILRRINALYRKASLSQVLGRWKRLEDEEADLLKRARPTKKFVSRFPPTAAPRRTRSKTPSLRFRGAFPASRVCATMTRSPTPSTTATSR